MTAPADQAACRGSSSWQGAVRASLASDGHAILRLDAQTELFFRKNLGIKPLDAAVGVAALGNVVGHAHRASDVLGSALLVGVVANTLRAATSRRASGYSDDAHDRSTQGRAWLTGKDGCA